jgi:flagellar basal-body rod protein FlgB
VRQALAARVSCFTEPRIDSPSKHAHRVLAPLGMGFALSGQVIFLTDENAMPVNLDTYLGVHAQALKVRSERTELLARNLANADTPGYKARDIDFREALANVEGAQRSVTLRATSPNHLGAAQEAGAPGASLKYRTPLAPALDGNTVDAQLEQAAFAENAVRYQATLSFLSSKFRALMTAITGQ